MHLYNVEMYKTATCRKGWQRLPREDSMLLLLTPKPTPMRIYLAIFLTVLPTWDIICEMRSFTMRNETLFGLQKEVNLPHGYGYPLRVSEDKLGLAWTAYWFRNVPSTWRWSWGSSSQAWPTVRFTVVWSLAINWCPLHTVPLYSYAWDRMTPVFW